MLIATPRKSTKLASGTAGVESVGASQTAVAAPSAKGKAMLVLLIASALLPRPRSSAGSSSSPMMNMKKTRPSWLTRPSVPSELAGKSSVKVLGEIAPRSEGPNAIPASTSAITSG